jgi:hypothetical protein
VEDGLQVPACKKFFVQDNLYVSGKIRYIHWAFLNCGVAATTMYSDSPYDVVPYPKFDV